MATFFLTLLVFVAAVGAMAVGVLLSGRRLQGSCGGVGGEACTCSPEKQAQCKEKSTGLERHADVPVPAENLLRK